MRSTRIFSKSFVKKITFIVTLLFGILVAINQSEFGSKSDKDSNTLGTSTLVENTNETTPSQIESTVPTSAPVSSNIYKVVKVVDGDTIDVDINGEAVRVRMIGVDTPETVDPRKPVQCFGKKASENTKRALLGKFVRLEDDKSQSDKDKYGRLLRYVFLDGGVVDVDVSAASGVGAVISGEGTVVGEEQYDINFNLKIIKEGFAHEYTYKDPYKYQKEFEDAEDFARRSGVGLWGVGVC